VIDTMRIVGSRLMVDTFRPLELGEGGSACEDPANARTRG